MREWGKEGRTKTVGLVGRCRVQRERERKNTSATAVHALPARNGVSVIYGGHSRLELSLSENMFTPGGWNIRSGFGPTTTGRLHFSTFCLPENVTVPLLWSRKRERDREASSRSCFNSVPICPWRNVCVLPFPILVIRVPPSREKEIFLLLFDCTSSKIDNEHQ